MTKKISTRRCKTPPISLPDPRCALARRLNLMAGVELQHGHHAAAEFLAWRAEAMRERLQ